MTPDQNPGSNAQHDGPAAPATARPEFGPIAEEAASVGKEIRQEAAEQAQALKDTAQAELGEAADKAKSFAAEQKDTAAGQLGGISGAMSRVADELEETPETAAVAGYARDLAGGLQRVSETIKRNSVDDLLAMAEDFGRRQPVAFLGAAALAGFVASRFVLASAQRRQRGEAASSGGYDPDRSNAYGSTGREPGDLSRDGQRPDTLAGGALE